MWSYGNKKTAAAVSAFTAALAAIVLYLAFRVLPMTDLYLGEDIEQYSLLVFLLAIPGLFAFRMGRKSAGRRWMKIGYFIGSALLILGVPLIFLLRNSQSFRGLHWALKALLIGAIPVVLLLAGAAILYGQRWVSLLLVVVFAGVVLFHLALLVKIIPKVSRGFSAYSLTDALISVGIVALAAWAAWLNLNYFRGSGKSQEDPAAS